MHRSSVGLPCVLLLVALSGCGGVCDSDDPCAHGRRPASGQAVTQGFAGVSYAHSDVIANGCEDCAFVKASLGLWRLEQDPGKEAEATAARAALVRAPDAVIMVEDRYEYPADEGVFLACTETTPRSCAVLNIGEAQLWTLHINHPSGVTPTLKVFRPGGAEDLDAAFDPADPGSGNSDGGTQGGTFSSMVSWCQDETAAHGSEPTNLVGLWRMDGSGELLLWLRPMQEGGARCLDLVLALYDGMTYRRV